eukprot:2361470-Pleurochrysis_carterae.AAC.3
MKQASWLLRPRIALLRLLQRSNQNWPPPLSRQRLNLKSAQAAGQFWLLEGKRRSQRRLCSRWLYRRISVWRLSRVHGIHARTKGGRHEVRKISVIRDERSSATKFPILVMIVSIR